MKSATTTEAKGYIPDFISKQCKVPLPILSAIQQKDLAPIKGSRKKTLDYIHFSLALSKKRRFPYFTATNIDGKQFRSIPRRDLFGGSDRWSIDDRATPFQWGDELYRAAKSDFHRGHMTKREDPQWGETKDHAAEAARSTFYFANSVPQVQELNSREWRSLESYILKKQTGQHGLKICLFTGPVLSKDDPYFVTKVAGEYIQIPVLFWKVIYFTKDGKTLNRVGFLMGQKDLLLERKIAVTTHPESELEHFVPPLPPLFADFKDADTYQVNVQTIEQLSGLRFAPASEPFKDDRLLKILLKAVEVDDGLERYVPPGEEPVGDFELEGLVL